MKTYLEADEYCETQIEESAKQTCHKLFSNFDFKIVDDKLFCNDNGKAFEAFWSFDFLECKEDYMKKH